MFPWREYLPGSNINMVFEAVSLLNFIKIFIKSILTARRISNSKAQGTNAESSVMNTAVFLKISATGDHYIGSRRTR
jgi:hypothetical protein